jgi:hypothetical protein
MLQCFYWYNMLCNFLQYIMLNCFKGKANLRVTYSLHVLLA